MENEKITIAVLVGGSSPEREVSKESGKAILVSVKDLGYRYKIIDPAYGIDQPDNEADFFKKDIDFTEVSNINYVRCINSDLFDDVDVVFIALHGKWGEDGTVQSLLELRGIKYTGAGVLSSALAMDKTMSKIMFQHFDVKTPTWFMIESPDESHSIIKQKIKKFFGYPCIIKANDQGSTFGLTLCRGDVEVSHAIADAFKYSNKVMVEQYIPGRELTVGILDQQALPVLEIIPKHGLYDYECKYTDGMSEYIVPAELPDDVKNHLQQQALLAYNSVGCANYGRVDFRLTNDNKSYCLEVNTLPGMTSHSLIPKMAAAVGIDFNKLIDKIIKYALM
ncbi:MAG: D-alanine--D-alanine ligase [Melioribacteraceae bacterium]|nr:D-alanine--D-alanine ligase [Melioribacteraceae bacterium]MCF8356440.1 D-alanine--D-alanine ligase [Melioribacteraceae bacterium]MCF8394867.1 D-alanine--D-alanine ligase [Melioribacteraceae bacterium]MCF8420595.1 D-alanine--D-alanine ligase [Melioribacteraceae bacterium]